MSQYGSIPPPGPYVPPAQGAPAQGFQQPQAPSIYQPVASNYGVPGHPHKAGGAFGQMMNQAVSTGKPMFNKLGKTISSKLGSKPAAGPPQHLQNYQNFQDHQGQQGQQNQPQGYQQQPGQSFSPQPQQQQWGQQQTQQQPQTQTPAPPPFVSPQQSPYQQSSYGTPASGHSGQNNYFPQQTNQVPNPQPQTPQQPPNSAPTFNAAHFEQSGLTMDQYMQAQQAQQAQQTQQGQFGQGQQMQGQPQAPFQQEQQLQGQYPGQQMGVVGGMQNVSQPQNIQSPHMSNVSPEVPPQPVQSQWGQPQPGTEQPPPPGPQQQAGNPLNPAQPYNPVPSPPIQQEQHQQWNTMSPVSPHGQGLGGQIPHSISPPPPQQGNVPPQIPSNKPNAPQSAPTEFIAELPADMGNLTLMESKPQRSEMPAQGSQYHAYQPSGSQTGSPSPGFTIPRRSVSASSFPLADPWRFADPLTELPTREFYILADLLFDALDRRFEPKNTGLLEATKVLGSWVLTTDDAKRIFSYKSYSAFGKLWSLEGIPHVMVPCEPSLTPNWNFNQHSHAPDLKLAAEAPTPMTMYPTYMPALNRAGWYKFLFLQLLESPHEIGDLMPALCSETYKPGVLNHPDLNKRDKSEMPALQAKAAGIHKYSIGRVCEETKTAMAVDPDVPLSHTHPAAGSTQPSGNMSPADMAVQMHKIQMERQFNDMAVKTVLGGGITFGPVGGYSGGYGSLV